MWMFRPLRVATRPCCFFLNFIILSTHSEVQTSVGDKAMEKKKTSTSSQVNNKQKRTEHHRVELEGGGFGLL